MRKFISWFNILIYIALTILLFIFFYLNKNVDVTVDYIFGARVAKLSNVLGITFVSGSIFGLIVSFLLGLSGAWKNARRKAELKKLEERIAQMKQEQGIQ